jgi:hypothetical protein
MHSKFILNPGIAVDMPSILLVPDGFKTTVASLTTLVKPEFSLDENFIKWFRKTSFNIRKAGPSRLLFFGLNIKPKVQEWISEIVSVEAFKSLFGDDLKFYTNIDVMLKDFKLSGIKLVYTNNRSLLDPSKRIFSPPWMLDSPTVEEDAVLDFARRFGG